MEITEISSTYSRKVQLDQFEPVEYSETITAVLDDGDDPDDVSGELRRQAKDNVERGVLDRILAHKMESKDKDDD